MDQKDLSIWLYGSRARGNADVYSDIDVFIASDFDISNSEIKKHLRLTPQQISISRYSWDEINKMAEYGSIFLHHLYREGYPLWESSSKKGELSKILSNLGEYKNVKRDLKGFRTVIKDIYESIDRGGSKTFELSVLATVLRHSSILGCWIIGNPSFGRIEPVSKFVKATGLNKKIAIEFPLLYDYRLFIYREIVFSCNLKQIDIYTWLRRAENVLNRLEEIYNGKN